MTPTIGMVTSDPHELAEFRTKALGASEVGEHTVPGLTWTVPADPDGNQLRVDRPG